MRSGTTLPPYLGTCRDQDLLKVCLCLTSGSSGDAVYNSPIFETEVKGGAYSVNLHLYRRALVGVIAGGFLSLHTYVGKRSRLHFVRGSREEAARTPKSHFETGRCPEGNGFPVSGI